MRAVSKTKQTDCKKTTLLLTKEKYLFYQKLDLYFYDWGFNDITLYFRFWTCIISCSRKIASIYRMDANISIFSTVNHK